MNPILSALGNFFEIGIVFIIPALALLPFAIGQRPRSWLRRATIWLDAFCFLMVGLGLIKPLFSARVMAQRVNCMDNMRRLSLAIMAYENDWDGYPPASQWADRVAARLPSEKKESSWHCPAATTPYSYAFNRALDGASAAYIPYPADTVMLFESNAVSRNAFGDSSALAPASRHFGGTNVFYADGHGGWGNEYARAKLRWKP